MKQTRSLPPRDELVNAFEFEDVARTVLSAETYATIAGSNRAAFDRITFRPRMCVPVMDLDLSVDLFGDTHFTPLLIGPVADQRRYHPDAEQATVRGASAARAGVVLSSRSSVAVADLAREAKTPFWFSVYADDGASARTRVAAAVAAGCRVLCVTTGPNIDWRAVDRVRNGVDIPVAIKGVMTPRDARAAVERGVSGIVVSSHGAATATPIEVLPSIVDAVGGKATVLIDGSFRRGSDVLKALILGARGVLLARPVMWALSAYGANGVQTLMELLQTDLARHLGALGAPNLRALQASHLKLHAK